MDLFIYGTLLHPALRMAVLGGTEMSPIPATLHEYTVRPVEGDIVPLIEAKIGAHAKGAILADITEAQKRRLDDYEGAFGYALVPVEVETDAGPRSVMMYLPPATLAAGQGEWDLTYWADTYSTMAVHAATELFAHDPPLTQAQIVASWPMMQNRAWAKYVASQTKAPAKLRHDAAEGDAKIVKRAAPYGDFFRFQQFEVDYKQFDKTRSARLHREVFVGIDAVFVLPYDAARDRILLVEQIRMGSLLRGDPNPWSLEPIAGMIDATETAEQTARRESMEEAGLEQIELRHLTSYYPSPGSTTDYFHAYLGLCDLPDDHAQFGGLESEAEDLKLHLISFTDALALVQSGEINAGPLILALNMLANQRDALRADVKEPRVSP